MLNYELNQYLWPKISYLDHNFVVYKMQNKEEKEKEVLRACIDGDLETVKRLSSVITVREVRDYLKRSPLHIAVWYVNLLFCTKIFIK